MIKFTSLSNTSGGSVSERIEASSTAFSYSRRVSNSLSLDVMKACTAISLDSRVRYFLIFDKFLSWLNDDLQMCGDVHAE